MLNGRTPISNKFPRFLALFFFEAEPPFYTDLLLLFQHGEVCPAGWTPGKKTMKADTKGAKEYFESANNDDGEEANGHH